MSLFVSCDDSEGPEDSEDSVSSSGVFANPRKVTIQGYDDESDNAMEPFISRDGKFLFFNTDSSVGNKDIYIASYVNDTTFKLISKLGNVNSELVDGTPTMDSLGNFYYISTSNYDNTLLFDTIYTGIFDSVNHEIDGISVIDNLADDTAYHVNFDVEINSAGDKMYFVDGVYDTSWNTIEANIKIASKSGSSFAIDANSDVIMANVNTSNLEYAPCFSIDGLELFFNRFDGTNFYIYGSTRNSTSSPFKIPEIVSVASGFVEGPCLSPNEKLLYYHKQEGTRFVIYVANR